MPSYRFTGLSIDVNVLHDALISGIEDFTSYESDTDQDGTYISRDDNGRVESTALYIDVLAPEVVTRSDIEQVIDTLS